MKMLPVLLLGALLPLTTLAADAPKSPPYGHFEGAGYLSVQGYQELPLGNGRWYVAYQGNADTSPDWVDAAWSARSAQLCKAGGSTHFIALRYVSEAVGVRDEQQADAGNDSAWRMLQAAGPIYIPIYTPSGPRTILPLTAPSRLAAIRCISDPLSLKNPARAISVGDALETARWQGVAVPP